MHNVCASVCVTATNKGIYPMIDRRQSAWVINVLFLSYGWRLWDMQLEPHVLKSIFLVHTHEFSFKRIILALLQQKKSCMLMPRVSEGEELCCVLTQMLSDWLVPIIILNKVIFVSRNWGNQLFRALRNCGKQFRWQYREHKEKQALTNFTHNSAQLLMKLYWGMLTLTAHVRDGVVPWDTPPRCLSRFRFPQISIATAKRSRFGKWTEWIMNRGTCARSSPKSSLSFFPLCISSSPSHKRKLLRGPPVQVYFSVHNPNRCTSFQHQNTKPTLYNTVNYMVPTSLFGNVSISWKEKATSEHS